MTGISLRLQLLPPCHPDPEKIYSRFHAEQIDMSSRGSRRRLRHGTCRVYTDWNEQKGLRSLSLATDATMTG